MQKKVYFFLLLSVVLAFLLLIDGELRYKEILEWGETHAESDGPVVSSGFNGSGSITPVGDSRFYWGDISFALCNVPEEQGRVEQVVLRKIRDGKEVSSRTVYAPWHNIYYTLRNSSGGVVCDPKIFAVISPGSQVDYWIEARMSDGTVYQHYAVRLYRDDMKCNIDTEIYNAQGERQGTRIGRVQE